MKGSFLITTDNWFFAPDGNQYRAAWGNVEIVEDSLLGIKTNRNSSNWYAKIGGDDMEIIVAGCQIHYAVRCEEVPQVAFYPHNEVHDGNVINEKLNTRIYIAQNI